MTVQNDLNQKKVRDLFSAIADSYDLGNQIISFGTHIHFKKKALMELNLKPGQRLLDLCTGTGDLIFLSLQLFPGIIAVGVDLSEQMIEIANSRLNNSGILKSRVEFMVADALNLPFEDESFEAVTTAFGLRNIDDKAGYFNEVNRILKPQGRLVVLEFSNPEDALLKHAYAFYLRHLVPILGYLASKNLSAYKYLTESIFNYPRAHQIERIAVEAGFIFELKKFLSGFLSLYICTKK
ncbi:MAG: bifunctional demethylmenaquinone methyltransferase/2-methoxy-6-polyprenyl-1,4-benzoquinol methylase UbiE [Actinobacteria bacterium]|nr:bifunctional demethylmenaquinone methyltransferase/2-methoxy-6-polyprenyl-1,4-benzoquinol methylase UbiE [Actinomycetota bacterium]